MAEEKKGFFRGLLDKITGTEEVKGEDVAPSLPQPVEPAPVEEEIKPGFFERLKMGLSKTRDSLVGRIDTLILGKKQIDADTLE